jgi:Uma2 family endonuclease
MTTDVKRWTIEELHSLPEDGNKYELIHGELFVSPPPGDEHETIGARLTRLLDPYVAANDLGLIYHPRAVLRFEDSQAEPNLFVRQTRTGRLKDARVDADWLDSPTPILVVEIISPWSRRRDLEYKRAFYLEAGVGEYWIVDPTSRSVRVVRPGREDVVVTGTLEWRPAGGSGPFVFDVGEIFD